MATAANGIISEPIAVLQNMVASCPTFQTWCRATGTDDEKLAKAKSHVYIIAPLPILGTTYTLDDLLNLRPCCVINLDPHQGFSFDTAGDGANRGSGKIQLEFQDNVPTEGSYQDVAIAFLNNLGNMITDLAASSLLNGNLYIWKFYTMQQIRRSDPKLDSSQGDFHYAFVVADYGLRA